MDTEKSYGAGTIVLATLGGAAVGAITALLLAPRSGRETRQQLAGYVDTAKNAVARVPEALKKGSDAAWEALGDGHDSTHAGARHGAKG